MRLTTDIIAVRAASMLVLGLLAACATYAPLPLDKTAILKDRTDQLKDDAHLVSPRLNMDDIAMLVLLNNPDLVAARAQRGLARAQVLAAGIVPNPSLSGSYGFLMGGPGTTDALAAGISQDLKSLIMRSSNRASAAHAARPSGAMHGAPTRLSDNSCAMVSGCCFRGMRALFEGVSKARNFTPSVRDVSAALR